MTQTMFRLLTATAVAASVAAAFHSPLDAAVMLADSEFGADTVVRDTATSRDWLTFSYAAYTVDGLLAALAPGGERDDWTFATEGDVVDLWSSAGVPQTSAAGDRTYITDAVIAEAAETLAQMIGLTTDGGGSFDFVSGYVQDPDNDGGEWAGAVLSAVYNGDIDAFDRYYAVTGTELSRDLGVGDSYIGWMYRPIDAAEVPAPGILGLLGLGLLGLMRLRR